MDCNRRQLKFSTEINVTESDSQHLIYVTDLRSTKIQNEKDTAQMSTSITFRNDSTISQMYNQLKNRKLVKLSTFRKPFEKAGVKKVFGMLLRLDRVLRTQDGTIQVNLSKRYDFVQIVPIKDAVKLYESARSKHVPSAKASVTRSAATKPVAKSKKKTATKTKAVKQVAAAVGAFDTDGLE